MNVKRLINPDAKAKHQEIVDALGTENNPTQWMIFMRAIDKHIPELSSKGRLSAVTIERSLIGQLGFSSFKEYAEAPLKDGGLNWSIGGWNAYRRAWSLVKNHAFLEQVEITAGSLNAFANEIKKLDIDFPVSMREFEEIKEKQAASKAENKQNALTLANEKTKNLKKNC